MDELTVLCKQKFPAAKLFMSMPFPRKLGTQEQTKSFMGKRSQFIEHYKHNNNKDITIIEHPLLNNHSNELYAADGVHLSNEGVILLVKYFKLAVAESLNINFTFTPTRSRPFDSPPDHRVRRVQAPPIHQRVRTNQHVQHNNNNNNNFNQRRHSNTNTPHLDHQPLIEGLRELLCQFSR